MRERKDTGQESDDVHGAARIRACEASPLVARFEVLVSPARPRTIIAANESLPSQGAGFLSKCHDFIYRAARFAGGV